MKKVRGQKRKIKSFLNNMDHIQPRYDFIGKCEYYHVPCGPWISNSKFHTLFMKEWLHKTEDIINKRPEDHRFSKVVALVVYPDVWSSQIILFYDEEYAFF